MYKKINLIVFNKLKKIFIGTNFAMERGLYFIRFQAIMNQLIFWDELISFHKIRGGNGER